jgi:hypothetical protein
MKACIPVAWAVALFALAACKKERTVLNGLLNHGKATATVTNYYVNGSTGNDANTGTTASAALKTIQAALNKTTDGVYCTIYVAAGTYHERLYWPSSGASDTAPVTLTNYNGGIVIVDGENASNSGQTAMIAVNSKSHIRISNIRIANNIRADACGIYVVGSGTDVKITSCKLYNIGWTADSTAAPASTNNANPLVIVGSQSAPYENIYFGSNEIYSCNTGYSEAMTLNGNINNFLVEYNVIHHVRNIGIVAAGHYAWTGAPASVNMARNGNIKHNTVYKCKSPVSVNAGIYVDGAKWINVEGNTCYENSVGISIGCENSGYTAEGINVRSNFVYNNEDGGIYAGSNAAGSQVAYSKIINNTFYHNYPNGVWLGEIIIQNSNALDIRNNIIQPAGNIAIIGGAGYTATNLTIDYNRYYSASGSAGVITFDWFGSATYTSLSAYQSATGLDSHASYGSPSFVSAGNFHLAAGSPCINAGDPSFVAAADEYDIDGESRIKSNRVDIGADEH